LIGGSLRRGSVNGAALAAAAESAPETVRTIIYRDMADLPHFNPDDDVEPLPPAVARMRGAFAAADAFLLSTPEYAGSLPGSFKNLLDWTIGAGSLYRRPVGWINPSSVGGARDAYQALRIVLDRAGAVIVADACIDIPVSRDCIDAADRIGSAPIRATIAGATRALLNAARMARAAELSAD
jgi:NAD(P)H-dependent FMN reductase